MSSPEDPGRLIKGSFSFHEQDLNQLDALATQRGRKKATELQRESMHDGSLFVAIREEPDRKTGKYGNYDVEDLAAMLRPLVVLGMDWLVQHGYSLPPMGGEPTSAFMSAFSSFVKQSSEHNLEREDPLLAAEQSKRNNGQPSEGTYINEQALGTLSLDEDPIY